MERTAYSDGKNGSFDLKVLSIPQDDTCVTKRSKNVHELFIIILYKGFADKMRVG